MAPHVSRFGTSSLVLTILYRTTTWIFLTTRVPSWKSCSSLRSTFLHWVELLPPFGDILCVPPLSIERDGERYTEFTLIDSGVPKKSLPYADLGDFGFPYDGWCVTGTARAGAQHSPLKH